MTKKRKNKPTKTGLTKADIKKVCDILRRDDGVGAKDYIEQFSWLLFLRIFEGVEDQLRELDEAEGKTYKPVIASDYRWSSWAKKDWKDKEACDFAGISEKTLYNYQKTHPEFLQEKQGWKSEIILKARMAVVDALQKDARLALKYLCYKCPQEFYTPSRAKYYRGSTESSDELRAHIERTNKLIEEYNKKSL